MLEGRLRGQVGQVDQGGVKGRELSMWDVMVGCGHGMDEECAVGCFLHWRARLDSDVWPFEMG